MPMLSIAEFILIIIFFYLLKTFWKQKSARLPPGPRNLPFIGYLFRLGKKPHITLTNLSKSYGEVFYLRVGNRDAVVLNGHNAIAEAFCDNSITFAGRPNFLLFKFLTDYFGAFSFMEYSSEWRYKRKITTKAINAIVDSRHHSSVYRDNFKSLCTHLANKLRKNLNTPYDLQEDCIFIAYQMIQCFCFGTFNHEPDDVFKEVKQNAIDFGSISSFYNIINAFKEFKYFTSLAKLYFHLKKLLIMMDDNIVKRLEFNFDEPTCVTHSLKVAAGLEANPQQQLKFIHDVMNDIIGAGVGTTSHFLYHAFLYATVFSEWQFKIQQQIDEIAEDNEITLDDIGRFTFLNAFRLEVARHSCFFPYGIYRTVVKDTIFRSYLIPKNTLIIPNIYSAHFDERIWTDPHKFDPNRFLTETGDIDINIENHILLFGLGSRRCIGQHLADKNISTILAYLFKQFSFKSIEQENLSLEGVPKGTIIEAQPYKIVITERI